MKYIDLSLRIYYLLAPTIFKYFAIYPRMLSYLLLNTYREMAYEVILVYHLHMPS